MVHQHFLLVPVFDVVEAVALGAESVSGPVASFDRKTARKRVVDLSTQYNLNVNPDATIEDLPVGVRQRVEILKALYRKSDVLVLDEPSAVPTPFETEELFAIIRGLAEAGTTVIFITHKLNEVLEVADRITVLRRGRVAGTVEPKDATREDPREPHGRTRRRAQGREGPGAAEGRGVVVLALTDVHVRDDRQHMTVRGVSLENPGRRDPRAGGRSGQRPDEARRGDRRGCATVEARREIALDGSEHSPEGRPHAQVARPGRWPTCPEDRQPRRAGRRR